MKLSTRARYALRMMVDVARHGGEHEPVSLAAVAERTELSRGYLEQLAQALRNARLLRGVAGRYGGYRLAKPPAEIPVGEVIEASIGPVWVVDCLEDPHGCPRTDFCECRVLYSLINSGIAEVLNGHTLADLMSPKWMTQHGGKVVDLVTLDSKTSGAGCAWNRKRNKKREAH